jgi:hypothetical protein
MSIIILSAVAYVLIAMLCAYVMALIDEDWLGMAMILWPVMLPLLCFAMACEWAKKQGVKRNERHRL